MVGVKDAPSQLDQLALVAEQEQTLHPQLSRGHQQRSNPVARLQQQRRREPLLRSEIQAVFPQDQHQITAPTRLLAAALQLLTGLGQLIGGGTALHQGLRANEGQAIHHAKGGVAGALCPLAPLRQGDRQPQTPPVRQQWPEVGLQQLPGIGREARLPGSRMDPHTSPGQHLQPIPLGVRLSPAGLHPNLQTSGEIQHLPRVTATGGQGPLWAQARRRLDRNRRR